VVVIIPGGAFICGTGFFLPSDGQKKANRQVGSEYEK